MTTQKLYYPIGEVAKLLQIEVSAVRYWEKEFSLLKPKKNKRGVRFFTPKDLENLRLIHHLVKEKKLTIAGAKQLLSQENEGITRSRFEVIQRLEKIKQQLENINTQL